VSSSPTVTLEVVGNTVNPSSEKAGVGGSTPSLATTILNKTKHLQKKNVTANKLAVFIFMDLRVVARDEAEPPT